MMRIHSSIYMIKMIILYDSGNLLNIRAQPIKYTSLYARRCRRGHDYL